MKSTAVQCQICGREVDSFAEGCDCMAGVAPVTVVEAESLDTRAKDKKAIKLAAERAIASNEGWEKRARAEGLALWEKQPEESSKEYMLWEAFVGQWPAERPTLARTATLTGVAKSSVQQVANRWRWGARLSAWQRECQAERTHSRRQATAERLEKWARIRDDATDKLMIAVEEIDAYDMSARDIATWIKTVGELDDRINNSEDAIATSALEDSLTIDIDGASEGESGLAVMDKNTLGAVLDILQNSGALGRVGVRQTTTTTTEAVISEY